MHFFVLFWFLFIPFCSLYSADEGKAKSHLVIVSVAPYKYFVEAVAGDTVTVILLVPPSASFHDYEPTPKQVLQTGNADIWFRIGESFETKALKALESFNTRLLVVDLRKNVDLIIFGHGHDNEDVHSCCHANGADLHIWLSARQAKIQAQDIASALIEVYPEHKQLYQQNLQQLSRRLDALDKEIGDQLRPLKNRTIMVAHPAYGYFARDYNLTQLPIEYEGKDPSPRQLQRILEQARAAKIKTIFVQKQYGTKGAYLIANEIGAKVDELNPYSGDYFETMHTIANRIASQDQNPSDK